MAVVKNLLIRAGADFSSMKKEIVKAQKVIADFKTGVEKSMKLIGVALGGLAIGSVIKDAVSDAMKVEAAMMVLSKQMGASSKAFLDWANNTAVAFNLSRSEAIRFGATYSNLITTFTTDTQQVSKYTTDLLKASSVVASATGRNMEDVMERIRSGMLGNTEAIEDLGINIYVNLLQTTKAFKQFAGDKSWDQLSFQVQQQIRYFAILEQVANKFGTEVYDNTASRQAQFVAQLKNTQLALGQAFLPIYNAVLPALTRMAQALSNAMSWLAMFMRALFNYKETKPAAAITDQAGAVTDLGDAYKKAGKKAQTAIASFDQLNLVGNKAADAADAADAAATPSGVSMPDTGEDVDNTPAKIKAMADKVRGIINSLASNIQKGMSAIRNYFSTAFEGLGEALEPFRKAQTPIINAFKSIGSSLQRLMNEYFIPVAKYLLGTFIPSIVLGITRNFAPVFANAAVWFVNEFAIVLTNYTNAIVDLWNTTLMPAIEDIRVAFLDALPSIAGSLQDLLTGSVEPFVDYFINDFALPIAAAVDKTLVPILSDIAVTAIKVFADTFRDAVDLVNDMVNTVFMPAMALIEKVVLDTLKIITDLWKKYGGDLLTNISTLIENIRKMFQKLWDQILKPIVIPFLEEMNKLWDSHLKGLVSELGEFIMKLVNGALEIINKFFVPILGWLFDKLAPGFVRGFNDMIKTVSWAIGVIADVLKGVTKELGGIIDFLTGVFTGNWKKAWQGLSDIFKGIADGLYAIIKGPLNLIIDGINKMIDGMNKIKIDVPDWIKNIPGVPDGIKSFGINIDRIPRLATGTNYVAQEGLAYLHQGEAVVPEKYNPAAGGGDNAQVVSLLGGILTALQSGRDIKLSFDKTGLVQSVINGTNDIARRTGRSVITT